MIEIYVKKQDGGYNFREGESLEMFTHAIHDAVEDKFRVPGTREMDFDDSVWAYVQAVEPGRAIFRRSGRGARIQNIKGLWAVTYTRDPQTFDFTFGTPERVIESVAYTPIKKSADYVVLKFADKWAGLPLRS